MLFDTHCHMYDESYLNDVDSVLKESFECGIKKMLIPGNTLDESIKAVDFTENRDNVFAAVGIHPSEVFDLDLSTTISTLKQLADNKKVLAIGEIGLDYYWHKEEQEKNIQKKWFREQIKLAKELNLPIIIHSRDACKDTLDILKEENPTVKVVFHCFSYSVEVMEEIVKMGWYIGLDGPVTFKNAVTPKEVAKKVPLEKLLLETDCPYLTPHPHRGKRNNPKYLTYIARAVAEAKGMTYDELCAITYENSCDFFGVTYE